MASHVGSLSSSMFFNSIRDLLPATTVEDPVITEEDPVVLAAINASITAPASVIIKKTDEEIELIARDVLENKMRKFQCAFDILPQIVKLEDLKPNLEQDYEEYGHQFLIYLQHQIRLELMRNILKLAAKRQLKDLRDFSNSGLIAIARGGKEEGQKAAGQEEEWEASGMGEDREAAAFAASQCALKRIPTICVTIVDDVNPTALSKKPFHIKEHTFLLLGIEHREFETLQKHYQGKIRRILKHLQHGILFDPSLKLICPLSQIDIRGHKLLQYMKVRGLKTVRHTFTRSYDQWQEILVGAERCSRAITGTIAASGLAIDLALKEERVRGWVLSDMKKELNRIFPKLIWSMDVNQGQIWIEGNVQFVAQAQNDLQKWEIRTNIVQAQSKKPRKPKKQIQYRCIVQDFNFTQLRRLSSNPSSSTATSSSSHSPPSRNFISPSASTSVPTLSPYLPNVLSPTQASTTSSRLFVPALALTPPRVSDFQIPKSRSCRVAPLDSSASTVRPESKEGKAPV